MHFQGNDREVQLSAWRQCQWLCCWQLSGVWVGCCYFCTHPPKGWCLRLEPQSLLHHATGLRNAVPSESSTEAAGIKHNIPESHIPLLGGGSGGLVWAGKPCRLLGLYWGCISAALHPKAGDCRENHKLSVSRKKWQLWVIQLKNCHLGTPRTIEFQP